jgi:hypothetical protein
MARPSACWLLRTPHDARQNQARGKLRVVPVRATGPAHIGRGTPWATRSAARSEFGADGAGWHGAGHSQRASGATLERDREEVLDAARPLPPDEETLIGDLTEDEDRLFLAAILSA